MDLASHQADPLSLFAVLDIYWTTRLPDYRTLARTIGNNILEQRFVRDIGGPAAGYFMSCAQPVYVNVDAVEPYALLALQAAIDDREGAVPPFINGAGYTEGEYLLPDGSSPTLRGRTIYELKMGHTLAPPPRAA